MRATLARSPSKASVTAVATIVFAASAARASISIALLRQTAIQRSHSGPSQTIAGRTDKQRRRFTGTARPWSTDPRKSRDWSHLGQHLGRLRGASRGKPQPEPAAREGRLHPDEPHLGTRDTLSLAQPFHARAATAGGEQQVSSV